MGRQPPMARENYVTQCSLGTIFVNVGCDSAIDSILPDFSKEVINIR